MDKFCQSCGMPMDNALWGTESNGSESSDYCKYCYIDGKFTNDWTMKQMKEFCIPHMVESGMSEEESIRIMDGFLPNLKRWKS